MILLLISLHISSVIEPRFTSLFYSLLQLQPGSSQTYFNSLPGFAYLQRQGVYSLSGQFVPVLYHLHCKLFFLVFNYNFPSRNLYPLPLTLRLQLQGKFDSVLSVITHCTTETATRSSCSLLSQATQSLNITFHTKMLQPPPFLGNPLLDVLCFLNGVTDTEHTTPGSSVQ